MATDDTGVTELLHRASDGLTPDVDRLVSGGIARGRSRRRRARIGTTVASLAVIGVVGGLAVVVPRLGGADSARDPDIASDGPSVTATETPTETPTPSDRLRDIPAAQVPTVALSLLDPPVSVALGKPDVHLGEPGNRVVTVRLDGMVTQFGMIGPGPGSSSSSCESDAESMGGSCQEIEDGVLLLTWGPADDDGVTCQGASVERSRHEVYVTSCNAAERRDSPPLADEPPLSVVQLTQIVANDYWFE